MSGPVQCSVERHFCGVYMVFITLQFNLYYCVTSFCIDFHTVYIIVEINRLRLNFSTNGSIFSASALVSKEYNAIHYRVCIIKMIQAVLPTVSIIDIAQCNVFQMCFPNSSQTVDVHYDTEYRGKPNIAGKGYILWLIF